MTSFFSQPFLDVLLANETTAMNGAVVRMYVFPSAPLFEENDPRYTGMTTITELSAALGWGQYIPAMAPDNSVIVSTVGGTNYAIAETPWDFPNNFPPTKPMALAFVYQSGPNAGMVGKLMFATNSTFLGSDIILYNQDGIIAAPDPVNVGPSNNRWLMSWTVIPAVVSPPAPAQISAGEGELVVSKGVPPFEPARTQHVWMYPQRINMIANPSFEAGTTHWKSSGALTRLSPGIDSAFYGHMVGTVMESNTWPTRIRKDRSEGWTIHLTARGDGELKIGLLSWPATYDETVVDWGPTQEVWDLNPSWVTVRTLRKLYDVSYAALRLETNGTFIDVDRICVEPGWLPANLNDWPYFDGDSLYGALDDYSWYGNKDRTAGTPTRAHKTYSCWYNHRRAVTGRLFQWSDPDDTGPGSVFTDEEVAAQGMVYSWVPAGTPVYHHLDVLFPNDPQAAVPDVAGGVTPSGSGILQVTSPWL